MAATAITYDTGVLDQALAVTATSDVRRPDDAQIAIGPDVSVEAWFRVTAMTGMRETIVDKNYELGVFVLASREMECGRPPGVAASLDGPAVALGQWTHVVCILDATSRDMYVDGALVAHATDTGPISDSTYDLTIGQNSPNGEHFVGDIDSVRIWRRRLTPAEICRDDGCQQP